jgi:hypothetical protein
MTGTALCQYRYSGHEAINMPTSLATLSENSYIPFARDRVPASTLNDFLYVQQLIYCFAI